MRIFLIILLMLLMGNMVFSKNLGVLPEVLNPENIQVRDNEVFVVEGATIYVFSTENLELIKKMGRKGEGPGELKVTPFLSNSMSISGDQIIFDSIDKLVFFSREGNFIKEKKRSPQFTQMLPIKDNFIVRKRLLIEKKQFTSINLFDSKTGKIRELYKQEFSAQRNLINMIPDSINIQVHEDKVFIEESPKGFFMEVFNHNGEKLYSIEKEIERIKLSKEDREGALNQLKVDPFIKMQRGGWEGFKSQNKMIFPDFYPSIQDFVISDNKIYVRTHKVLDGREEYIIMGLKGKILKRVFLPAVQKPSFTEQMLGTNIKFFSISRDKFYYLIEKEEEWELHVTIIN